MQSSDLDLTIIVDDLQLCHEEILRNIKAIINKYGGQTSVKNYKNPQKMKMIPRYLVLQ